MTEDHSITITKDGDVLKFRMVGELLDSKIDDIIVDSEIIDFPVAIEETEAAKLSETEELETVMEAEPEALEGETVVSQEEATTKPVDENLSVVSAPDEHVIAEIEDIDLAEVIAQAKYHETVAERSNSRLHYEGIYEDTDIVFDLQSSRQKESIILKAYREGLKGYIYTLEVGDMIPVLLKTGEIELRDADREEIILYMPAPFLIDRSLY